MAQLEQQLLQKASGETRLNPDEQRYYSGTFRERVLLTVSSELARSQAVKDNFSKILAELSEMVTPMIVKLTPKLSSSDQMYYMKLANQAGINATIVHEASSHSPFAIVIHTDHAVDFPDDEIAIETRFSQLLTPEKDKQKPQKKSFLQKLFSL